VSKTTANRICGGEKETYHDTDIQEALALLADYGASPHPFDLNCDRAVGIVDFLAGLAALTDGEG